MKYIVFTFINCFALISLIAQDNKPTGYYGNRNYIDLSMNLNSPILYKVLNKPGSYNNPQEIKTVNSGISIQVGRMLKNNYGFALNFSSYKIACYSPIGFTETNQNNYFSGNFDPFMTKTTCFMPIYTASYFDNAPLGLEFEAGLGFNTTSIENNGLNYYAYDPQNQAYEQFLLNNTTLFDFDQKFKSYSFMLGLKTRYALTENLLFNLGIRFTASTRLKNSNIVISEYSNDFQNLLITSANKARTNRIAVLGFGLTYVF
ncbi:MAG: hypothetical protein ACEQR5_00860 [Moraxellaceae bacterium]